MKANPTFSDVLKEVTRKAERQGYIQDGQLTKKGWDLFMQQYRQLKARKPN